MKSGEKAAIATACLKRHTGAAALQFHTKGHISGSCEAVQQEKWAIRMRSSHLYEQLAASPQIHW